MAVIFGGLSIPCENLADFQYISTSLNTAAFDLPIPPKGQILNTVNPVTSSYTYYFPPALIYSISGGGISYDYYWDFYFRIHLSVYSLNFGNILSDSSYTLNVWNTYLVPDTMTELQSYNLPDITVTSPITLPYSFAPLADKDFIINAPSTGIPSILGNLRFVFDTETPILNISGRRVKLWPFPPQLNFSETKEYKTDVIQAFGGETRTAIRDMPRSTIKYNYEFRTDKEYALAREIGKFFAQYAIALPLWSEIMPVTSVVSGNTSISVDTTYRELSIGQSIVIWKSIYQYSLYIIESFTSTSITFTQPIYASYTNAYAIPLKDGYAQNGFNLERQENHYMSGNISIISDTNYYLAAWPNSETFLGLPVISTYNILTGGLPENLNLSRTFIDNEVGGITAFNKETFVRSQQVLTIKSRNKAELYTLKRFVDYLKGKYIAFWLPSFHSDLIPVSSSLPLSSASINVVSGYWSSYETHHIRVVDRTGIAINIQVASASDIGGNVDNIQFSSATTVAIPNIKQIMTLTKVRANADSIEFSFEKGGICTVRIPVIEILG